MGKRLLRALLIGLIVGLTALIAIQSMSARGAFRPVWRKYNIRDLIPEEPPFPRVSVNTPTEDLRLTKELHRDQRGKPPRLRVLNIRSGYRVNVSGQE